jgi:integrase/recombinase XerD
VLKPMKKVPSPKFTEPPVEPFDKEEIERLLKACDYCNEAYTNDRCKFTMRRPLAMQDRAIVLTLLDTGLRATELCSLLIGNVDLTTGKVSVIHGVNGGAKGSKGGPSLWAKKPASRNANHTAFDIPSVLLIYAQEEVFSHS